MRHSFVSYRLAATQNAPQTALESGHDQAVLFKHYRELVRPKDAERFFSIRPAAEDAGKDRFDFGWLIFHLDQKREDGAILHGDCSRPNPATPNALTSDWQLPAETELRI